MKGNRKTRAKLRPDSRAATKPDLPQQPQAGIHVSYQHLPWSPKDQPGNLCISEKIKSIP